MEHPAEGTLYSGPLDKPFQGLFGDPTLKVNVKSSEVDGKPRIELDIEGRCPTAYGVPALYIVGKDRLISPSAVEGAPGEAALPEGMRAYRNAVVDDGVSQTFSGLCLPYLTLAIS